MAIADFGGSALGQPIEFLTADHQNKPDIGASKFREWADTKGLTMLLGGSNTGVSLAIAPIAKEKKIPLLRDRRRGRIAHRQGLQRLHGPLRLRYDGARQRHGQDDPGSGRQILVLHHRGLCVRHPASAGGDQGRRRRRRQGRRLRAGRRSRPRTSRPISCRRKAPARRWLGLANAGADFSNSLKAAHEFGLTNTMKPAALLAFITDIHALGLETAQGLYLTAGWYWDLNDKSRAFGKRFLDKTGAMPTYNQAAYYSATMTYLNAVKAVGTTDADKVMEQLHKTKVDDMYTSDGIIRPDGLLQHSMYVMQVKTPAESKGPWDYYKLVKTMSGEEAYGSLADSTCPLVKK